MPTMPTTTKVPQGSLMQLPNAEASAFAQLISRENPDFTRFRDTFTAQGFKFLLERAKVFVYSALTERGVAASTFAIFPSLIPAKPSDPFHIAIGIAVHSSGGVVATTVKVDHKPFRVVEFTVHELVGKTITSRSISIADLTSLSVEEAARKLGVPKLRPQRGVAAEAAADPQLDRILATSFDQIIRDPHASPLYTPAALRSLLRQKPTIAKFAYVNQARYAAAGLTSRGFACSCTCCNGCTTTSFTLRASDLLSA